MRLCSLALLFAGLTFAANAPRWVYSFGSGGLNPAAVAVDASGNTYLAGSTLGNPFTATPGAYQAQNNGGVCYGGGGMGPPFPIPCRNAFVIKLDPGGKVIFATYLGGTATDDVAAIAVDSQRNVYVAGPVQASPFESGEFPVTSGAAFKTGSNSSGNFSFLAKLNASGSRLEYSTLIPGVSVSGITVGKTGEVFFTGSWSFPFGAFPATSGAYQSAPPNLSTATVIGEFNSTGSALLWGTYLGGTLGYSDSLGLGLDADGNVLIGGTTTASDFPATSGQFSTSAGNAVGGYTNIYFAKLSQDGSKLISAALLGPGNGDLFLGPGGDIYLACSSTGLPVTGGGFGLPAGSGSYLLRLSADGSSIASSIYVPLVLTGENYVTVDAEGNAYVLGSGSIPTTAGAFQPSPLDTNPGQGVIAKITRDGEIAGVTYLGVPLGIGAIAVERDGSVVVATSTSQIDLPGAVQAHQNGTTYLLVTNFFPAITLENSASYVAGMVAPGELASIQGYGLGPLTGVSSSSSPSAAMLLGGVQVYFDNFAAPIVYAQAQQINIQVPWEISGRASTRVRIVYNGALAGSATVPVAAAMPGVFYITICDGSINSPSNPASPGDSVSLYGTGGGAMSPPGITGGVWSETLSQLTQSVGVDVGGEAAAVQYAGSAPTLNSGFFQINVTLPADLTPTAQPLRVTIGGVTSAPVAISIR